MAEKILYFLGAGASAQALPLARSRWGEIDFVPSIPEVKGLAYELEELSSSNVLLDVESEELKDFSAELAKNAKELAAKANEFGDVDTYAKYLKIMTPGGKELQQLKQTLAQYFSIKQLLIGARDRRYIPWFVSIMNRRVFPENVKILSWNYDFQVELAAAHFDANNLEDISYSGSGFSYSPSWFPYYPNLDPTFNDFDSLSLIHLNGIAGFGEEADQSFRIYKSVFQKAHSRARGSILKFLSNNNLHSLLHFAWDGSQYHSRLMQYVHTLIEETTIMVVVGYSFPFFNREVDKAIFEKLKSMKSFRKIYYQDPVLNGQQLRAQFGLDDSIEIEHVSQVDNFHIPFEY